MHYWLFAQDLRRTCLLAESATIIGGIVSMEAEYMAASATTQEAMWLNQLNNKFGFKPQTYQNS